MANFQENYLQFCGFCAEIEKINYKPDLLKSPTGKNFRAISEAEILKNINSYALKYGVDYSINVKESNLNIQQVNNKLVFIATCIVHLDFFINGMNEPVAYCEALGMGIDDGDKAMGKAYTYAVKYALLKKLRLTYADDPDATESKPIQTKSAEKKEKAKNSPKKEEKSSSEPLITEKMTFYIIGLVKKLGIEDADFKKKYGYYPSSEKIPMEKARKIIDELKAQEDDLPF